MCFLVSDRLSLRWDAPPSLCLMMRMKIYLQKRVAPKQWRKKEPQTEILPSQKPQETKSSSLSSTTLAPPSTKPPAKNKLSLFSDDDDEDIFAPKSSSKSNAQINKVALINNQSLNPSKPASKSLFSDDEDDIFGNFKGKKNQGSNQKPSYAPATTKYTSKSLFDDDDEDDEDLFSSNRLRK